MNNIILIDLDLKVLHQVMENTDVVVEVLMCGSKDREKLYEEYPNRIIRILSVKELEEKTSVFDLDYNAIEETKGIQERIETQLRRYLSDMNLVKLMYYRGLSFWLKIFKTCKIDGVLCIGTNHGQLYDGIPVYYAALKKIPSYCFEPFGYGRNFIYDETNQRFVQSREIKYLNSIDELLKEIGGNHDVFHLDWDLGYANRGLISLIYRVCGFHTLDFLRAIFIDRSFLKKRFITGTSYKSSYLDRRKSYRYMKRLGDKLSKIEEQPDFSEKYVYLSLQFEPEGRNLNLTIDSQIVFVKMIAEVLPDGWKVYVKEHPHQYMIDTAIHYYYINFIENFKSIDFYKSIKEIPNVRLIKRTVSAEELINHSKAVINRTGTVLIEALIARKPIIVCAKCHPLADYAGVLHGFEDNGIKNSIEKIAEGYVPDYSEAIDFLNQYVINGKNEMAQNAIGLIKGSHALKTLN